MVSQACVCPSIERYTDTMSHKPQWMHHNVHKRGQRNSSPPVINGKQISYLIWCFAAWCCRVQSCSQNLPSAFNPFSIFPFFLAYSIFSLSFALSTTFSFSPSSLQPVSLFFLCSCCLSFTDGVTWGNDGYAKHSSNECKAPTMKMA